MLTYVELAQNPSELPRDPVMCVLHPQMPYSLLCATCESPICGQCHSEHADGRNHNLINVDDRVGDLIKNELKEFAAAADVKVYFFFACISSISAVQFLRLGLPVHLAI